jgi:uncharacterized protein
MKLTLSFYNGHGRLRSIWWVVVFFLILFVFLFPLILLSQHYEFDIALWHQILIILTVSMICQALTRNPQHKLIGRINSQWFIQLGGGMLIGALLMILPAMVLYLFGALRWETTGFSLDAAVIATVVVASAVVAEELLFRGFIFQRLIKAFGIWPAQLIIGVLFVLTHINNAGMTGMVKILAAINIFVASILFGVAYYSTKRLAMPLGIHFMANFVQGIILGFGVSGNQDSGFLKPILLNDAVWLTGGDFGLEASVPGLLIVIGICLWGCVKSRKLSELYSRD